MIRCSPATTTRTARRACEQLGQPGLAVALAAQIGLGLGEVADLAQHVVQLVGRARPATVGEALQLQLDVGEHGRVEQLAQLLGAEQVAQQVAVERQGRGAALGQRGVALVHVRGDPVEQQALGERRGLRRVDGDHLAPPGCAAGRAPRAAPAGRTRPAGTRATSPAGSGTSGTWPPRPAGRRRAGAAATAACAGRAGGAAAAAPGPRTRGTGRRTATSAAARRRPARRSRRDR